MLQVETQGVQKRIFRRAIRGMVNKSRSSQRSSGGGELRQALGRRQSPQAHKRSLSFLRQEFAVLLRLESRKYNSQDIET